MRDYLPAVPLEAGALLVFLWDLWLVEDEDLDLWCLAVVEEDDDAEDGAVDWAKTEPDRATPATSREAIASLRIMIMSLEILIATDPAGTRQPRAAWRYQQCLGFGIPELNGEKNSSINADDLNNRSNLAFKPRPSL
ncbi:MAG TPA: hypothetical protein VME63_10120 [Dyella sp.]|uniref:hypothetical protein n=1 Tax=Dyella sp. TaxID=1869338 RepID=UPI002C3A8D09|nr:hypothetical protein [Dyella sp.]HTV85754.1 hypothetical protein [Dyella sp.]